ncbi:MAG: LTA synthase family protein [Firmicutes bacterium]|nr:LTA synthase family protein [Bacillota bacterium]
MKKYGVIRFYVFSKYSLRSVLKVKQHRFKLDLLFLIFVLTIAKIIFLYHYTIDNFETSLYLNSFLGVFVIYALANKLKGKKIKLLLRIYTIISVLLFLDLLYFDYFGFMPSVTDLMFIGQVGTVKRSVIRVLKPMYLVMLIDLIPLYYFIKFKKVKLKFNKEDSSLTVPICLIVIILMVMVLPSSENGTFVFNRYGVFSYHMYDFYDNTIGNFDKEVDKKITYQGYVNGIGKEGKYFGVAENRNIIVIQLESFQNFLINHYYRGQELTPNLNRILRKDSLYFDRFYQQVGTGNTSDCEFITSNSMHSLGRKSIFKEYPENSFYSLYNILDKKGYSTTILHGYESDFWNREEIYPSLGIDKFISLKNFEKKEMISFGLSDEVFFDQSVKYIKELKEPYYAKLITLTSHHPYVLPESEKELILADEHKETLFGDYLQTIHYTDKQLGKFIEGIKRKGLYENSLIIFYGDHAGLYPSNEENKKVLSEYFGYEYNYDEAMNIPLIYHIPGSNIKEKNSIVGGQIDYMPTLLNLLGIVEDKGILFGQDLNNSNNGFVANQYYIPEGSFIDDEKMFIMSEDGIFENSKAWDLKTRKPIDIHKCKEGYEKALEQIEASKYIITNNEIKNIIK